MVNRAPPTSMLATGGHRGCQETNSPPLSRLTTPMTRSLNSWSSTQARSNSAARDEDAQSGSAAATWSSGLCRAYKPAMTQTRQRDRESGSRASDPIRPARIHPAVIGPGHMDRPGRVGWWSPPARTDKASCREMISKVPGTQPTAGTELIQNTTKRDHGVAPTGSTLPAPTKRRP